MNLEFSRQIFEKNLKYQVASKSVQWEPSCSMWTDRQTDTMKLPVAFRHCAKTPNKKMMANRPNSFFTLVDEGADVISGFRRGLNEIVVLLGS